MKEKLQILIQNENLTPSGLARRLEVNPPVISHILKGRNQPSYELIRRIITRFPKINPYWLLGDSEEMYNPSTTPQSDAPGAPAQSELFHTSTESNDEELLDIKDSVPESEKNHDFNAAQQASLYRTGANGSDIERIIVVYSNGTFESLTPRK